MKKLSIFAIAFSILVGVLLRSIVGSDECVLILKSLSQISLAMFGVIGVWLSLLYRDEIVTGLWREHPTLESQCRAAQLVLSANERCRILFRGFLITAMVFALSWVGAQVLPILHKAICLRAFPHGDIICMVAHAIAVFAFTGLILAQGYVVLTSISPIKYITDELKNATSDAAMVLRAAKQKAKTSDGSD